MFENVFIVFELMCQFSFRVRGHFCNLDYLIEFLRLSLRLIKWMKMVLLMARLWARNGVWVFKYLTVKLRVVKLKILKWRYKLINSEYQELKVPQKLLFMLKLHKNILQFVFPQKSSPKLHLPGPSHNKTLNKPISSTFDISANK